MKKIIAVFIYIALAANWCAAAGKDDLFAVFSSDISPYRRAFDGFKEVVMRKNRPVRTAEHNLAKEGADGIARLIAEERPLLVFAVGPEAAKFARERIRNIPVVFSMVLNAEPIAGPNVTGVSLDIPIRAKLEKIRRILPNAGRVGMIYSPATAHLYREAAQVCRGMDLRAVGREIPSGKELRDAFDGIVQEVDLLLMIPDTKIYFPKSIEYILMEGFKHRMPVVGLASSYTRAGAIVSFEADYADLGRQAGEMAVRIIEGEKPSLIEPSRPKKVRTSINMVVAERLRIRIPPEILKEASDVFN